jgi:hypothetical protein
MKPAEYARQSGMDCGVDCPEPGWVVGVAGCCPLWVLGRGREPELQLLVCDVCEVGVCYREEPAS